MKNLLLITILIFFNMSTYAKEIARNGKPLAYPFIPSQPFCQKPTKLKLLNLSEKQKEALERMNKMSQNLYVECKQKEQQYEINIKEYEKNKKEYDEEMAWRKKEIDLAENYFFAFRPNYKLVIKHAEGPALLGNKQAIMLMIRGSREQTKILAKGINNETSDAGALDDYYTYTKLKYIWLRVFMEDDNNKNFKTVDSEQWQSIEREARNVEKFLIETGGIKDADNQVLEICAKIYG